MARNKQEILRESLEDAAIAGAKDVTAFLTTYRGKDPERLARVRVAAGAVKSYTGWQSSRNNMATGILMATRQIGLAPEQTLDILKTTGLLPDVATLPKAISDGKSIAK
jgi:hypothetical protein